MLYLCVVIHHEQYEIIYQPTYVDPQEKKNKVNILLTHLISILIQDIYNN